jgi:NAD(P)-dependent dehydrogenase (short-subunit alcohol dehydrogenase family)
MSIVIVGAGPNLGAAVARRFGREGMSVGLIARDAAKLEELADMGVFVGHSVIAARIAPGEDHEPDDIAEALWRRHTEHGDFQLRIGFDE